MNEHEAKVTALYQYLLSKSGRLSQTLETRRKNWMRMDATAEDVRLYYEALLLLAFWDKIAEEVWNIIK